MQSLGSSPQVLGRRKSCHFDEVRGEILYVEISKSYKISLRPLPRPQLLLIEMRTFGINLCLPNTCGLQPSDNYLQASGLRNQYTCPLRRPSAVARVRQRRGETNINNLAFCDGRRPGNNGHSAGAERLQRTLRQAQGDRPPLS
ncbi:hypothetical protein FHW89_001807 [Mucilaginibacter sp. SG564]|nr:hypothetical protein [Mucilaginibacter sp. SG564]